jgi:hypothetical protein
MRRNRAGYRIADLVGRALRGLGWLTLGLAPVAGGLGFWLTRKPETAALASAATVLGLLMVAAGQLLRATVDSAVQTREILAMLQSGPLQWATRPPPPETPAEPPQRTPEQAAWLKSPSTPLTAEMRATVASQTVRPCVNPFCSRLVPEDSETCPHCRTRQRLHSTRRG